jgi:hypothetical protein
MRPRALPCPAALLRPVLLRPVLLRPVLLAGLLAGLLGGCHSWTIPIGAIAGVNIASIATFGRAVPDLAVSAVSGRDCSVVRLDQGKSYCAAAEPPPAAPEYCTRSLGVVDCWAGPQFFVAPARGVADGRWTLDAAQERNRTDRWPKALDLGP